MVAGLISFLHQTFAIGLVVVFFFPLSFCPLRETSSSVLPFIFIYIASDNEVPHIVSTFLLGGNPSSMQHPLAASPWSDSGNGAGAAGTGSPFLLDGGKGMPSPLSATRRLATVGTSLVKGPYRSEDADAGWAPSSVGTAVSFLLCSSHTHTPRRQAGKCQKLNAGLYGANRNGQKQTPNC